MLKSKILLAGIFTAFVLLTGCEKEEAPVPFTPPALNNATADHFTAKSAIIKGSIPESDFIILEKGIVWSENQSPTINDHSKKLDNNDPGEFEIKIEGLKESTTYYARTYAKYEKGITYSENLAFNTISAIYNGNIKFHNQREVDEFGAMGYTQINGSIDLQINMENDITSLKSLEDLESVKSILIAGVNGLTSLEGLNKLKYLSTLWLAENSNLLDIGALSNLEQIEKTLFIQNNNKLQNLQGLRNVTSTIRSIHIEKNDNLESLEGLENITEIEWYLHLTGNNSLKNLSGLENLESLGLFYLANNSALKDITALNGLRTIRDNLIILFNENLDSLDGLEALMEVGGFISITSNEKLMDFCALKSFLNSTSYNREFQIDRNMFNPGIEDIQNGNCSLQ